MLNNKSFDESKGFFKTKHWCLYIVLCFTFSILFNSSFFYLNNFCPDFIFKIVDKTFFQYIYDSFHTRVALFYSHWCISLTCYLINIPIVAIWIYVVYYMANIRFVINDVCNKHAKIINSCKPLELHDKVALVVCVCNDFSKNALLQTANQTYKNLDVWICDDSNEQSQINEIDDFVKKHKNFYVCRRNEKHKKQHPTKIGNVSYWLNKHGNKYDYLFENDSSSLVTSTFVENALCYFHSPILSNMKINCVNCNGNFYQLDKLITKFSSINWQISNEILRSFSIIDGDRELNDGWCSFYKISTLRQIPIEEVECTSCDAARGLWLSKKGYVSIVDPFDFGGKMGTQNIKAFEKQRIKWYSGDLFMLNKHIIFNSKGHVFGNLKSLVFYILPILVFPMALVNLIILYIMKIDYINYSSWLITLAIRFVIWFLIPLICIIISYKKSTFKVILSVIAFIMIELAMIYKRFLYFYIFGIIFRRSQRKWNVTKKTLSANSKTFDKFKTCIFDICWIIIVLASFLAITCLSTITFKESFSNQFIFLNGTINSLSILWLTIFPVFILPSLIYIIFSFIGENKIKNGYDPNNKKAFQIEKYDFRYKFIKNTKIWKKQHSKQK